MGLQITYTIKPIQAENSFQKYNKKGNNFMSVCSVWSYVHYENWQRTTLRKFTISEFKTVRETIHFYNDYQEHQINTLNL